MENAQREREKEKNESKGNKGRNTLYTQAKQLVLSPLKFCLTSLSFSLSLPPSPSATSCRIVSRASFCVCLVTVFGFVSPPIHTHTHMHTSAYKYVWMCAAALLLCLPFCWLPMLTMLCFFLPLIAAPRSRLQIFSSQKRDRVSPSA